MLTWWNFFVFLLLEYSGGIWAQPLNLGVILQVFYHCATVSSIGILIFKIFYVFFRHFSPSRCQWQWHCCSCRCYQIYEWHILLQASSQWNNRCILRCLLSINVNHMQKSGAFYVNSIEVKHSRESGREYRGRERMEMMRKKWHGF